MITKRQIYKELEQKIDNTPLVKYTGKVPNGNSIYIKRECDNPFGSPYDRVFLSLFWHYEKIGRIKPGDKVLETTSGSAGVSFAGIGKLLGYECYVAMPAGGEKAREEAIKKELQSDDHLILTSAKDYISGFIEFLKEYLPKHKDIFFLNHSMGPRDRETGKYSSNEVTLQALEGIANEVICQMSSNFAYFIPAIGNGSSILGPGRVFQKFAEIFYGAIGGIIEEPSSFGKITMKEISEAVHQVDDWRTKIIAFETFQSAVAFNQLYPNKYQKKFGIEPGTLSRHRLPGTSYQGIDFPHIRNAVETQVLDKVVLISDENIDAEYLGLTGRNDTEKLLHWDKVKYQDLGRSSLASLAVALDTAEKVNGKNILIIAYDKANRYDSLSKVKKKTAVRC